MPDPADLGLRAATAAIAAAVAHEALAGEPPRPPLLAGAAEAHQRSGESP